MSELWRPSAGRIADANLTRFMRCVNARRGTRLASYEELYAWSLAQPQEFWREVARFADLRAEWGSGRGARAPAAPCRARASSPAARLNFAENLLKFDDGEPALVFRNEAGARRVLSYRRAAPGSGAHRRRPRARRASSAGDRVAGFLPNLPETTIAMLATASLGAIWSSCSPDFGVHGVLDRFGQIAPKVLFTADGYFYAGKKIDSLEPMAAVLARLDGVARVVVIPYVERAPALARLGAAAHARAAVAGLRARRAAARLRAAAVQPPALHPLLLRHHGRAEVHRARRGRHAPAAREGAPAARGPEAQRPPLLLHHLRLDDVELADERARHRGDAGAVRRQPVPPGPGGAVAHGGRGARHDLRHERQVPLRAAEARLRAGRGDRPRARCARSCPPAPRCCRRASTTSIAR